MRIWPGPDSRSTGCTDKDLIAPEWRGLNVEIRGSCYVGSGHGQSSKALLYLSGLW